MLSDPVSEAKHSTGAVPKVRSDQSTVLRKERHHAKLLSSSTKSKLELTKRSATATSGSSLFAPTRVSCVASGNNLQKQLYEASQTPSSGMVSNALGGTVRADHTIPAK